jgi:hypothetical protein
MAPETIHHLKGSIQLNEVAHVPPIPAATATKGRVQQALDSTPSPTALKSGALDFDLSFMSILARRGSWVDLGSLDAELDVAQFLLLEQAGQALSKRVVRAYAVVDGLGFPGG